MQPLHKKHFSGLHLDKEKPSIWKMRKMQKSTFHLEGFLRIEIESHWVTFEKYPKCLQKYQQRQGFPLKVAKCNSCLRRIILQIPIVNLAR